MPTDRRAMSLFGGGLAVGLLTGAVGAVVAFAVLIDPYVATVRAGEAQVTESGGGSFDTEAGTHFLPADVHWTDASGSGHQSGTPECLRPPTEIAIDVPVVAATVDITLNRPDGVWSKWTQVVWVDCRSRP